MAKPAYSTNCFDTFIRVAEDCPAAIGEAPPPRGGDASGAVPRTRHEW